MTKQKDDEPKLVKYLGESGVSLIVPILRSKSWEYEEQRIWLEYFQFDNLIKLLQENKLK